LVQQVEKYNGVLAWRALIQEYQPATGGRFNAMLMGLLNPKDWA
jgi:hypothetical protein